MIKKICLPLIFLVAWKQSPAQTKYPPPVEINEFVKRHFVVEYINRPNAEDPTIYNVSPDQVFTEKPFVFGQKTNNGMDSTYKFLNQLFGGPQKKGNTYLQFIIYQALRISDKAVRLIIVNDQTEAINADTSVRWNWYLYKDRDNQHRIYPGIFRPEDSYKNVATIILGEKWIRESLRKFRAEFIYLMVRACSKDFGPIGKIYPFTVNISSVGESGSKLNFVIPFLDRRPMISRSIALAYAFRYSSFEEMTYTRLMNDWFENDPLVAVPTVEQATAMIKDSKDDVPVNRTIPYQFKELKLEPMGDLPAAGTSWKLFKLFSLPQHVFLQNEMILALLFKCFLAHVSYPEFMECIKYGKERLIDTPDEMKLPVLIENLCLGMLQGRTLDEAISSNSKDLRYLYGLALVDLFNDFPTDDDDSKFTNSDKEMFRKLTGGPINDKLLEKYFEVRKTLLADKRLNPVHTKYKFRGFTNVFGDNYEMEKEERLVRKYFHIWVRLDNYTKE